MTGNWIRGPVGIALLVGAALLVLLSTIAIVPETQQAVILRLEKPYRTINAYQRGERFGHTGAGVIFRIPFVDRLVRVDKRVLDLELKEEPLLSTDQLPLQVDAFARFRVVDPLKLVLSIGTVSSEENVALKLEPLFRTALRNELGKGQFASLLSPERGRVMTDIKAGLQRFAAQYGVEIVDVRIKRTDLPEGSPLNSAYERMRTARQQEARTITAQGQRDALIIEANARAEAARISSASFGKDPQFYDFYRAMQSYRTTFLAPGDEKNPKGSTQIILSPQNSYLKEFMGQR